MSVEGTLSRKLDIRFIDARNLVNEAKSNMNAPGYVDEANRDAVLEEAMRLFTEKDSAVKKEMRRAHWDLENYKSVCNSSSSSDGQSGVDWSQCDDLSEKPYYTTDKYLSRLLAREDDWC